MAGNPNYQTDVLSTTLEKYAQKQLVDNIFLSSALMMKMKPQMKSCDGGSKILEPLMYTKNSTAGSYSGYDLLDTTPQNIATNSEFDWKEYSVSVTISGKEEIINSGEAAAINLIEARFSNASSSLIENMNEDLYSDGTGNFSKALTGFGAMIESSGTYGNIARSTNAWWQSYEENTAAALTLDYMRTALLTPSKGGTDGADLITTTQTLYEAYQALVEPHLRLTNTKLADSGFMNYEFHGVPIVWDEQCPAGVMYFMNTKYFKLRYHPTCNFKTTQFRVPTNQDAKVAFILWKGNLTCSNAFRQGKLTGKTA